MRTLKCTGAVVLLLSISSFAGLSGKSGNDSKATFNSFTVGPALPIGGTAVMTRPETDPPANPPTDPLMRSLKSGWEAGWTFFGKPFLSSDNALSGLAFGGKVSYSRWNRDSTWTPVTILGVQGIVRYYIPPVIKQVDLFGQAGAGWFIGEYGFFDPDTLDRSSATQERIVTKGQNWLGVHFGVGMNADVVEVLPVITVVATKSKLSTWLSLNLGMTF